MNSSRAEERIRDYVLETPLVMSGGLGTSGTRLLLKLENRQDTGSFKLRGATNKLLTTDKRRRAARKGWRRRKLLIEQVRIELGR